MGHTRESSRAAALWWSLDYLLWCMAFIFVARYSDARGIECKCAERGDYGITRCC